MSRPVFALAVMQPAPAPDASMLKTARPATHSLALELCASEGDRGKASVEARLSS